MTIDEAYDKLVPLVGTQNIEYLDVLYRQAKDVAVQSEVPKAGNWISYKQFKFARALAEAGGSTLQAELDARGIKQGDKPWHIDKSEGKRLIDEFIELGYQDLLPSHRN